MYRSWDWFFFAPADPTPLAIVRICGGLLLLYVHLCYSFDLQNLLGKYALLDLETANDLRWNSPTLAAPWSWPSPTLENRVWSEEDFAYYRKWETYPERIIAHGSVKWSIWFDVTDPTAMRVVHGGTLLAMFCLTIGFCTRMAAILTWLAVLSYVNRASNALFGMDAIMSLVALYLMIGPSGAALSVDRWLARRRALRAGRTDDPSLAWPPQPLVSANFALRLLQVHLCLIYFASGISKLQGPTWWSGVAVWGTMANYEFSPMNQQAYMDFLTALARRRWLWELVMTGSTAFTLAFEIGFPFLIWLRPTRWLMICSAVFLHLGIAFFMGLIGFSTIMIVVVLSFIPAETYHFGLNRVRLWLNGPDSFGETPANLKLDQDRTPARVRQLSRSA